MMANKITPISETDRNALKRKTAATLPDNPAAHGMKAAAVKPKFWQALTEGEESVAGLIDRVVREANEALGKTVERVSYSADTEKITLTFGDGSTEVLDCPEQGPPGQNGVSPTVLTERVEGGYQITVTAANGVSTFILPDGAKGKAGDPFRITKTYTSVAEMHAGFATDNVPEGGFILIATGSVEDADNAKLFVKGATAYQYLIDLSGATGIRGPAGSSIKSITKTGTSGLVDTYTVTLTDGSTYTYTVTNGRDGTDGEDGISPMITVTSESNGHTVEVVDKNGSKVFFVSDGDPTGMLESVKKQAVDEAKAYTDDELAAFDFIKVVDALPATGLPNKFYLVPKSDTRTQDLFDEYVWANGKWEWVTTKQMEVDLTPYSKKSELLDLIYPVGSIYMSMNSTKPDVLFGGTWYSIPGRFLLGAGSSEVNTTDKYGSMVAGTVNRTTVGERGGESAHKLTTAEMPSHSHSTDHNATPISHNGGSAWGALGSSTSIVYWCTTTSNKTGSDGAHNNMPPYMVVYMWRRVS